ncbi:hypothetical protein AUJ46_02285 [Candidatus Peregrinibacteria bacterium CG1_02_54_53]|nr:MAG: hypothetical protein AUJ46_02285 [Candidatus Peregrinibacteria bacterium CG1_02_54_53]
MSTIELALKWQARLYARSRRSSLLLAAAYRDLDALRRIPILHVAHVLGMNLVKTGGGTYAMREEREITSLVLFEKTNSWKRFSGKENGGVSQGSPIDLVMHIRDCSLREAAEFLSSRFL